MLLKHRFSLIISAAFFCAAPLSFANQTFALPSSAGSSSIAAWYQARQQQINSHSSDLNSLLTQANAGDANAQYELGLVYQSGRGAPQDLDLAQRWFKSAAEAGNVYALYSLSLLLREQGGQANLQHSVKMQEKAALAGHPDAQYGLGMLYANGQYVARDLHKARHWLEQAQQRGNTVAQFALSELAPQPVARPQVQPRPQANTMQAPVPARQAQVQRPRPVARPQVQAPAAATEPTLAALPAGNAGRRGPATTQASARQSGAGVQASRFNREGLSAEQLQTAAQQGDKYAQLMLGALYEDGKGGVNKNYEKALRWYLKAARQDYPKAQHNLALLYEDGRGIKQDYKQAAIWYDKAARAGFSESQNNLAVLYILGRGVEKDRAYAEQLLQQAVAEGNANAQRNLKMLQDGAG